MMLKLIIDAHGGRMPEGGIVTFANTGKELEETLEFIRDCELNFVVKIHWLEYADSGGPRVVPGKRPLIGSHGFREVDFDSASRNGEPFEAVIRAKAEYRREAKDEPPVLPNPTDRWCSGEMKHWTMDRYMQSIGMSEYDVVVGLRADEPKRVASLKSQSTKLIGYETPLAAQEDGATTP